MAGFGQVRNRVRFILEEDPSACDCGMVGRRQGWGKVVGDIGDAQIGTCSRANFVCLMNRPGIGGIWTSAVQWKIMQTVCEI